MKGLKCLPLAGMLLLFRTGALLAQSSVEDQTLVWTRYYFQWRSAPQWSLHWEADNRLFLQSSFAHHQFISHLHLHRSLAASRELWGGLSFSLVSAQKPEFAGTPAPEWRLWQAVSARHSIWQHRIRTEQRFFRRTDSTGYRFAFRMRYAITAQIRLHGPLAMKLGNEIMLQKGEGIRRWFDQNRLWGGLELTGKEHRWAVELQYLWLWQQNMAGDVFYDRDIMRLTVSHRIE